MHLNFMGLRSHRMPDFLPIVMARLIRRILGPASSTPTRRASTGWRTTAFYTGESAEPA